MKTCAWISRHEPTREQRASLVAYHIHQIDPPGRLWSAADGIALSQQACGRWPDLFVVVLPLMMLKHFVERVDGRVPILRSVVRSERSPSWVGPWEQIIAVNIVVKAWSPNRKEA